MKIFDRLLLFLISISLIAISIVVLLISFGFFQYDFLQDVLYDIFHLTNVKLLVSIFGILMLLISFYLLSRTTKGNHRPSVFRQSTELGEIAVSFETIENLVIKVTSKVKGVRELKSKVNIDENDNLSIVVRIQFDGETPIPQITNELQAIIKGKVEEITGLSVTKVHVMVSNISQTPGRKVVLG